jgi:hypothetical protein
MYLIPKNQDSPEISGIKFLPLNAGFFSFSIRASKNDTADYTVKIIIPAIRND